MNCWRLTDFFPPWLIGLLVFGGTDPILQFGVESAFQFGFCRERNLNAWSKCGAAPITRCCLKNHSQVRREMGDDDATNQMMHLGVAKQNNDRKKNKLMKKKEVAL